MKVFRPIAALLVLAVAGCSPSAPPATAPSPPPHHHHPGASAAPAGSGGPRGRLVVRADEQLRVPLDFLAGRFEEAFPGTEVVLGYGPGGAPHADVLLTGDAAAVARTAAREEPVVVARNPLVLAAARTATGVDGLADLRRPGLRVALCAAGTRCGDAARTVTALRPAAVHADGPAAVAAVVSGAADVALVHRTDVPAAQARLRVVDFGEGVAHADRYTLALPRDGRNPVAADAFAALARSALAQRVLSDAGFTAA